MRSIRRISTTKLLEFGGARKAKRIYHIKSLPAYDHNDARKNSSSKIEIVDKQSPMVKLRRFKTQQHLKPPIFGAVKTARERNVDWGKRKENPSQQSQASKSLTKSTNFKSPN